MRLTQLGENELDHHRQQFSRCAVEGKGVEELPPPEQLAIDVTQARLIAHLAIAPPNYLDLSARNRKSLVTGQLERRGRIDSAHDAARPVVPRDQHGLCRFVAGAALGADVVGGVRVST